LQVEARDVHFARGDRPIFQGLSCCFPRGKISVVAAASGGGKTTLLRMIACLLQPDRGAIVADGDQDLTRFGRPEVVRYRRRVGMLFQFGALLDTLTLYDNVALPLREHSELDEARIREQVEGVFEAVGLDGVDHLLPGELSGGMVKRAGLARALIEKPELVLCDEPFSGLDPPTVRRVEELLVSVNQRFGATLIVTSHHPQSTLRIGDHLVLIDEGVAVEGAPRELARRDERAAEFFLDALPDAPAGSAVR
jgi:phospholipid/cholesterol/gamma-HCH transport system ATP-binding protein